MTVVSNLCVGRVAKGDEGEYAHYDVLIRHAVVCGRSRNGRMRYVGASRLESRKVLYPLNTFFKVHARWVPR